MGMVSGKRLFHVFPSVIIPIRMKVRSVAALSICNKKKLYLSTAASPPLAARRNYRCKILQ